MIHFKCQCGFERDVSDESSGKSIRCPKCKTISRVPAPEFAEISHDPADYADDQPFTPDPISATKAVDRPVDQPEDRARAVQPTNDNFLLEVLFFLKVVAVSVAIISVMACGVIAGESVVSAVITVAAGFVFSIWTYVGAEAVRLLVEIERNTRKH